MIQQLKSLNVDLATSSWLAINVHARQLDFIARMPGPTPQQYSAENPQRNGREEKVTERQ
jgi:hypothetical protein